MLKRIIFIFILSCTLLSLSASNLSESDQTESATKVYSEILLKIKNDKNITQTDKDKLVVFGSIVSNNADKVSITDSGVLFLKKGTPYSTATMHFELPESLKPGLYEFSVPVSFGGVLKQHCDVLIGSRADTLSKRISFDGINEKSWKKFILEAPVPLAIYPGEKHIEVDISGRAGQQKSIAPIELKLVKKFSDDLTVQDGILLANATSLIEEKPENRIYLLEAENDLSKFRQLFSFFSDSTTESLMGKTSLSIIDGEDALVIADKLSVKLPAMVIMNGNYAVEEVLCFNEKQSPCLIDFNKHVSSIISKKLKNYVKTFHDSKKIAYNKWISSEEKIEINPVLGEIENGVMPYWNIICGWSGKAGLSLWGLNYESEIHPNPGDRCPHTAFDRSQLNDRWYVEKTNLDNAETILNPKTSNHTWGKGTAYASLYINSDSNQDIKSVLHLWQTGYYVTGWLDDTQLDFKKDRDAIFTTDNKIGKQNNVVGVTDQGGEVALNITEAVQSAKADLNISKGWHRLLLKFVTQQKKDEVFSFKAKFTNSDGTISSNIICSAVNPESDTYLHEKAMRLEPFVTTSQSLNLLDEKDKLSMTFDLERRGWSRLKEEKPIIPIVPFKAKLVVIIRDYDGETIVEREVTTVFPGSVVLDFHKTLSRGYYSISSSLYTPEGKFITSYPPDGFSVIGGTKAQKKRKASLKVATTYYYMTQDKENKIFFPWMKKMGIYLNIGSSTSFPTNVAKLAKEEGITLVADFYDTYSKDTPEKKVEIVEMAAPYTRYFKSYNEIDHRPELRMTPEKWVAREKSEYEAVKQVLPDGFYVGGSLVYPGKREWFFECLRLGIDRYHDAWDIHSYPCVSPKLESGFGNSPGESINGLNLAYEKVGRTNNLPFWIGETGARASHGLDARKWQADMVAKMIATAGSLDNVLKIGFLRPWHYNRSFSGVHSDIFIGHMPAEAATYTAVALIDGLPYERLDFGSGIQAAKFGKTIMLWSEGGKPKTVNVPLKVTESKYLIVDVVGRVNSLDVDEDGTAKIEISKSPVYILTVDDYKKLTD